MEKMVCELKKMVPLKKTTEVGDIVLIAMEKPQSVVYGLVTKIEHDPSKKDEWWHVGLHILSIPPQQATWTLRESQFTGQEIFTMGGDGRFVQALQFDLEKKDSPNSSLKGAVKKRSSKAKKGQKPVLRVVK